MQLVCIKKNSHIHKENGFFLPHTTVIHELNYKCPVLKGQSHGHAILVLKLIVLVRTCKFREYFYDFEKFRRVGQTEFLDKKIVSKSRDIVPVISIG